MQPQSLEIVAIEPMFCSGRRRRRHHGRGPGLGRGV